MMEQLSIVQDYILQGIRGHRVVKPIGSGETVWAGVGFSKEIGVLTNEHDVVQDLYEALEDWLVGMLKNGETAPIVEGIDLNSEEGQRLVAWHAAHRGQPSSHQDWVWTEEWQAGERQASREIEAGHGTIYESGEDFLRSLDEERAQG